MKHIKTFDNLRNDIDVGDWCAIKESTSCSALYKYFLNIPCQVVALQLLSVDGFAVKLRGIEKELWWKIDDIEKISKSKEEIEDYLLARKYNL